MKNLDKNLDLYTLNKMYEYASSSGVNLYDLRSFILENKINISEENMVDKISIKQILKNHDVNFEELLNELNNLFLSKNNKLKITLEQIKELCQCSDDRFASYSDLINTKCKEALE